MLETCTEESKECLAHHSAVLISFAGKKLYFPLTMEPDHGIISSLGSHMSHNGRFSRSLCLLLHALGGGAAGRGGTW